jgi:hypothetical protein
LLGSPRSPGLPVGVDPDEDLYASRQPAGAEQWPL